MTNWIQRLTGDFYGHRATCGDALAAPDAEWRRIGGCPVPSAHAPNQVSVRPEADFQRIKLRSFGADIEIYRWTLEFNDGSILDLSVNCLLEGCESRPMPIAGRRLKRIVVNFYGRSFRRRGRLEIWAQA